MTKIKSDIGTSSQVETSCNTTTTTTKIPSSADALLVQPNELSSTQIHISAASSSPSTNALLSNDHDLRPKFAILRHKSEYINQSLRYPSSDGTTHHQTAPTPSWFFNIPTTRSPFPDFGSSLPPEADEEVTVSAVDVRQ